VESAPDTLNPAQRAATVHGDGPLLIVAGAGTGKTHTLAHRVAHLIAGGADPRRILLLTFTRRAAAEMSRRVERILRIETRSRTSAAGRVVTSGGLVWAGTFHAIANRLLRLHAADAGLDPAFTVLDREDAADLLDLLRHRLGLSRAGRRFPRKGTCLAIYSRAVNAQQPLAACLGEAFPWCAVWEAPLRQLFGAYVDAKHRRHVLDYDDLLLYWLHLVAEPAVAARIGGRFDHILVDEYQDTNAIQAAILSGLKLAGHGVTVVGDDAQAIYSFRAATVRNILDFPGRFTPPATVVTLEENYRSTQPILEAANAVIALARERFTKDLFSTGRTGARPRLVTVEDESGQAEYVVERVLEEREAGLVLRQQAVLFRAAHHSDALEVELSRRNIPFVKYGGLRFLEAAHVKDVLCVLRWGENPHDALAAFRVLQLLPGVGPVLAERAWDRVEAHGLDLASLAGFDPPAAARGDWPAFCDLLRRIADAATPWPGQVGSVRRWYEPHLARLYDGARTRAGDLEQLEQIADAYPSRERFLSELTLDPPEAAGTDAGPPLLDEDYLVLSTIHSAKGQEWEAVYILNAADGCIPSDMATGSADQIEEERRLLYVAMTRAKSTLTLIHPLRFFVRQQERYGDRHVLAPLTRFLPETILGCFERSSHARHPDDGAAEPGRPRVDVAAKLREMWS
jgi:DNA helicase-2/ATP-dependent DNA helicase PcrA